MKSTTRHPMLVAYEAGWNASKRSTTYDLDAAERRFCETHEDPANMFSAGWVDYASDYGHYQTLDREHPEVRGQGRPGHTFGMDEPTALTWW